MYRKNNPLQMEFQNFYLPFGGELSADNRWVVLAEQIPWQRIDQQYGELFSADEGCPAKAARVGFGALIIKERLGTTDRETVEQIRENPYLQYFLGFSKYSNATPFHHSLMTHFRKRFSKEILAQINEMIVTDAINQGSDVADESSDDDDPPSNNGETRYDIRGSNRSFLHCDVSGEDTLHFVMFFALHLPKVAYFSACKRCRRSKRRSDHADRSLKFSRDGTLLLPWCKGKRYSASPK